MPELPTARRMWRRTFGSVSLRAASASAARPGAEPLTMCTAAKRTAGASCASSLEPSASRPGGQAPLPVASVSAFCAGQRQSTASFVSSQPAVASTSAS
ncbi:MAG: hypothetical protein IT385_14955 [Deltaproteobacteria bacterium]|nr:hypothetical protein [Deltaproteobacteria bacterium]